MSYGVSDTIAAIASAPGGGVRGVVRVSGPETIGCLNRCFQPSAARRLEQVVRASLISGQLHTPEPVGWLPCDLLLWPSQRSYTRQVAAELHTMGAAPLLNAALRTLCEAGARLARPGEFTLRAFLAGRVDLTQAEAVLGIIDAEDSRALDVALEQLAGGLAAPLKKLRGELLDLLAHLEAGLDFADEDIEFISDETLQRELGAACRTLDILLQQMVARGHVSDEPLVCLCGASNVGKSSLLNALADCDVAIVSARHGTTRDCVTRRVRCGGVECLLVDTPGVEQAVPTSPLAAQARQLADQRRRRAALELFCIDASRPLQAWERQLLASKPDRARLVVLTKSDLPDVSGAMADLRTSSQAGEGIEGLRNEIGQIVKSGYEGSSFAVASTVARCRSSLESAAAALGRARQLSAASCGQELVAVELRQSLDDLGQVVGAVYTEDILDRVFGRFCIGK